MSLRGAAYTVTRYAAGTWAAGVYTRGASSTFVIWGLISPVTGHEVEILPEGQRYEARWTLYAADHTQPPLVDGDYVSINSTAHLVRKDSDWEAHAPGRQVYILGEVTSG